MTVNNGDNQYNGKALFHAGIMNSGTIVLSQNATSPNAQMVFDEFSSYAGCSTSSYDSGSAVHGCLRQIPYSNFKAAMNLLPNFASSHSNDLAYVRRPDPSSAFYSRYGDEAVQSGQYARIPVIMGNMQDEATIFVPGQVGLIHNKNSLTDYFASWLTESPRSIVEGLVATYSLNPAEGLPSGTGKRYQTYPLSKINAAMQTDLIFLMTRRIALSYNASQLSAWSYLATYQQGLPWWGTYHTADLDTQFDQNPNMFAGESMDEAYISFVATQSPNGRNRSGNASWPNWSVRQLQMANFN